VLELRQRTELRPDMSTTLENADELPTPNAEPTTVNGWSAGEGFYIMAAHEDLCGVVKGFRFICGQWYGRLEFENGVKQSLPLTQLRKMPGA
jgi:hypothetical protein